MNFLVKWKIRGNPPPHPHSITLSITPSVQPPQHTIDGTLISESELYYFSHGFSNKYKNKILGTPITKIEIICDIEKVTLVPPRPHSGAGTDECVPTLDNYKVNRKF